jgi:formylglycine-generating enzyme
MVIVKPRRARPTATRRGARIGFGLALLLGCGRVSLGSLQPPDGDAGSAGAGSAGRAGAGGAGTGGAGAGGAGTGAPMAGQGGGVAGAAGTGGSPPAADAGALVDAGSVREPPSCRELPRCGVAASADCCEAPLVPGGSFSLTANPSGARVAVSVSSFRLDRFEVSVGRAREFVAGYDAWRAAGEPRSGTGSHPGIVNSGWQDSFTEQLPATAAELEQRFLTCGLTNIPLSTYGSAADARVPLTCVTWYQAFAFCAWDGGRLPTLAELAYAGSGGAENRLYPWGDAPPPNAQRASFGCDADGSDLELPECREPPASEVGSRPLGIGRFGQEDLAGSVSEWVLDGVPTLAEPCADCASLTNVSSRTYRGGSWVDAAEQLENSWLVSENPSFPIPTLGIRCARDE